MSKDKIFTLLALYEFALISINSKIILKNNNYWFSMVIHFSAIVHVVMKFISYQSNSKIWHNSKKSRYQGQFCDF